MRIQRLDLTAYGPFTDVSLDLSEGAEGLHLIYGDNEAGKSSSLRALLAWLFGIDKHTADKFLHSYDQLRIGGGLRLRSGEEQWFVRKKGNKGTVLDPSTGDVLPDNVLKPFLGEIDKELFSRLFGIDHGRLVQGGQEILKQSGDLGKVLFSAALGTAGLRGVSEELQSEADAIFKPRGQKMTVNKALSQHRDLRKRVKEASLPVSDWKDLHASMSDVRSQVEAVQEEIAELGAGQSRLERLKRVVGPLAERRETLGRLQELGDVRLLPEGFREDRKALQSELRNLEKSLKRARTKLEELRSEAGGLSVRSELLENQETIDSLFKELGAVEQAMRDRPKQEGKRTALQDEASNYLKSIRPDLGLKAAEELRTLLNNRRWLAGLAKQHALLVQKEEQGAELRDREGELQQLTEQLKVLGPTGADLSGLKSAVSLVQREGDIEGRLSEDARQAESERQVCIRDLERLGRYGGTMEELARLAFPGSEALDEFDRRLKTLNERSRERDRKQEEISLEKEQIEKDLAELFSSGDVPSALDLEVSRGLREDCWKLVRRKYIDAEDLESEADGFLEGEDLPSTYERRVSGADEVADRLRREADQVQRRAHLEARMEIQQATSAGIIERAQVDDDEQSQWDADWDAVWAPLRIDPGSPAEMKLWLVKAEKLRERIDKTREAENEAKRLAATCSDHLELLLGELKAAEETAFGDLVKLGDALQRCEDRVIRDEERKRDRAELERALADVETRLKRAGEKHEETVAERTSWSEDWTQAIQGLGLEADVHPEKATGTMERLVKFFDKLDKAKELEHRISGIDKRTSDFNERIVAFTDEIGYQRTDKDATVLAGRLSRELSESREARASAEKIEGQISEKASEAEEAGVGIKTTKDRLAALCKTAGVGDVGDLEQAEELSATSRALKKKLEELTSEIIRHSDGLDIDEVQQEADDSDVDSLDAELERIKIETQELHRKRDELRGRQTTIQNEIESKDGGAAAAGASEEAEQQLAVVVNGTEQYLRVRFASLILEQQIERYRRENQAPLLVRAGELFQRLTLSSFSGLRDELDDDGTPVLRGIRKDNSEVSVAGMSDGTRDQLFLALRLATIEQRLENQEPMPFIVDDILIGFDDDRTSACLEVLAELSKETQVLLFTHHRRVVELSGKLTHDAAVFVHELREQLRTFPGG